MLAKIDYLTNGSNDTFQIPFKYNNKNQIKVILDNIEVDFDFLNKNLIKLKQLPETNKTIRILRQEDISSIDLFENGEIFNEEKSNKIKEKLLNSMQEKNEIELTSLEKDQNGTFYRDLNMNFNKIKNIEDPENDNDIVNLNKLKSFLSFEKQIGFNIGDTILSSRNDQIEDSEINIGVGIGGEINNNTPTWIDRSYDQQLLKSDYPELSLIYPETPGGIVNFNNLIENTITFAPKTVIQDKNNYGGFYYTGINDGNIYYKINTNNIIIGNTGLNSGIHFIMEDKNSTIMVAASTGSNQIKYSTDNGVTWNNCNFTGETLPSGWWYIVYAEDVFFLTDVSASSRFAYSTDGINFIVKNLSSFVDTTKANPASGFRSNIDLVPNFYKRNGKYYWYSYTQSINKKFAMYEINDTFTTSTLITEVSSIPDTYSLIMEDGKSISTSENSILKYSNDFFNTNNSIDVGLFLSDNNINIIKNTLTFLNEENKFMFFAYNSVSNILYILKINTSFDTLELVSTINISNYNFRLLNPLSNSYIDSIIFYDNNLFKIGLLESIKGSNLTFDIPKIDNTINNYEKIYTKGK